MLLVFLGCPRWLALDTEQFANGLVRRPLDGSSDLEKSYRVTSAAPLMGCQQETDEGTTPTGKSLEEYLQEWAGLWELRRDHETPRDQHCGKLYVPRVEGQGKGPESGPGKSYLFVWGQLHRTCHLRQRITARAQPQPSGGKPDGRSRAPLPSQPLISYLCLPLVKPNQNRRVRVMQCVHRTGQRRESRFLRTNRKPQNRVLKSKPVCRAPSGVLNLLENSPFKKPYY